MARPPWSSRLRVFLLGVLCAMPLACMQVVAHKSQVIVAAAELCPVGSEGCPCTSGGGCDPGLWCDAGVCVSSYGGDGGEYEFEEDLIMEAPAPEPVSRSSSISGRASGRKQSTSKSRRTRIHVVMIDTRSWWYCMARCSGGHPLASRSWSG